MTWSSIHLSGGGVSLVLAPSPVGVPVLHHWGRALPDLSADDLAALALVRTPGVPHSALDEPRYLSLVPLGPDGFTGTPAVELTRQGCVGPVRLSGWEVSGGGSSATAVAVDPDLAVTVSVDLELTDEGLLRRRTTVTNDGDSPLGVVAVREVVPVADRATELLDLTGRWIAERVPQRHAWLQGTWSRTGRHGRTGHDATLLVCAGRPGFGFREGEVWAVHVPWSGHHTTMAERTPEGDAVLAGGEVLEPGEIVLGPGASYSSPGLVAAWSHAGLDGISARFHDLLRAQRPQAERKVMVNTWEAVYFDHDLRRLTALADAAADVGVERFVLDDGWFRGRRGDTRALGDWTVDPEVWPKGLHPLVDHVHGLGMDFGLWVEPEMVNPDSDLARAHPDWVLAAHRDWPLAWRNQQVLDLAHPGAYAHVRDALVSLLEEYPVAFLKWDHNRDLVDVPGAHAQTSAFYRLLDELRERQPGLEIETCASGGGRIDLGVLSRTDRVWPSDTIDAVERQRIQRWTTLLVPPEMLGSHLGGPVAHTTGRAHRLELRAATTLLGHVGIEWDLAGLDEAQRDAVRAWIQLHKRVRPLVATGRLVRDDHPDPAVLVTGVVGPGAAEAWYVVAVTAMTSTQQPGAVRLPGLDPSRRYLLEDVTPTEGQHALDLAPARTVWSGTRHLGAVLGEVGVRLGPQAPDTARVLRVVAD